MQATKQADKLSANNLLMVLLLVSFIVVGATVLVAKTLVVGLIRDTKVLQAEQKANKTLDEDLKAAPDLVASYQGLNGTANTLADALPTTGNFPGLLVAMENMSLDSGVNLKSVAPGFNASSTPAAAATGTTASSSSIAAPKPMSYSFDVVFDGNFGSLQKLLTDLELYDRPMRVRGLKLSGSGSSLSGTIDIETYYQDKATLPIGEETIK